jgi:hypothetical protein
MIAQTSPSTLRAGQGSQGSGRPEPVEACDSALTALFTPAHPQVGRYQICTIVDPIETVAESHWQVDTLEPLDAFGSAGPYDRFALSRLYGGRRVRVARGWRESLGSARDRSLGSARDRSLGSARDRSLGSARDSRDGQFESITLISPYPNASLTALETGTMIIRLIISRR